MISGFRFTNKTISDGRFLQLNYGVDTDNYVIRNVEGLSPPNQIIATNTSRYQDGSDNREITITLGPHPFSEYSVHDLRLGLHRHFAPGHRVEIRVDYIGKSSRKIEGVVETHEANVFSDDPLFQIKFLCAQPYFEGVDRHSILMPSTIQSNGALTTADITVTTEVETPFELELNMGSSIPAAARVTDISFSTAAQWEEQFEWQRLDVIMPPAEGLRRNEVYGFNTAVGSKSVTRQGNSLLAYLVSNSKWLTLKPGANRFRFITATVDGNATLGVGTIYYTMRFTGA